MPAQKPDPIEVEQRLKAAQDRALRAKIGAPLPLTAANLDMLSTVTDADSILASARWDRDSGLPGLLDATVQEQV